MHRRGVLCWIYLSRVYSWWSDHHLSTDPAWHPHHFPLRTRTQQPNILLSTFPTARSQWCNLKCHGFPVRKTVPPGLRGGMMVDARYIYIYIYIPFNIKPAIFLRSGVGWQWEGVPSNCHSFKKIAGISTFAEGFHWVGWVGYKAINLNLDTHITRNSCLYVSKKRHVLPKLPRWLTSRNQPQCLGFIKIPWFATGFP